MSFNASFFFRRPAALLLMLALAVPAFCEMPAADRIRIAEAYRMADSLGDKMWEGWTAIPFPVLLVTPDTEYLVRHPSPDSSFSKAGYDSLLKSEIYTRPRSFPPSLLASFPLNGAPTTVIGQAEHTDAQTSTPWVVTLLHEHFHQLQYAQPGYFDQVNALGLSGGDLTGMWMLNYPFPYESAPVDSAFDRLKTALADAVNAPDSTVSQKFENYRTVRRDFFNSLSAPDRKYMSFQLWQEGVARYTELRIAQWAADHYVPTAAFQQLPDYTPLFELAATQLAIVRKSPYKVALNQFQRVSFYIIGSAEAFLLDRTQPAWKEVYFSRPFSLDPLF